LREKLNSCDEIIISFEKGAKVEIIGSSENTYNILFKDKSSGRCIYSTSLKPMNWAAATKIYCVDWEIEVHGPGISKLYQLDLTGQNVYIQFHSSSLGDNLGWIPYVELFKNKHNCNVYCKSFYNELFQDNYQGIEFVEEKPDNIFTSYNLGVFLGKNDSINYNMHNTFPFSIPLQQIACDILGLEYKEIKPRLSIPNVEREKLVLIGMQSTAQAKYWNFENGWYTLVEYLKTRGFKVAFIDASKTFGTPAKYNTIPDNALDWTGYIPLQIRIEQLARAAFFIGLGSGLSWLSWAVGTPTVLISGFSEPYTEMIDCLRISTPSGKCTGCFNKHIIERTNWMWCPEHKGTERQFECTTSITSQMIIDKLNKFIKNENLD